MAHFSETIASTGSAGRHHFPRLSSLFLRDGERSEYAISHFDYPSYQRRSVIKPLRSDCLIVRGASTLCSANGGVCSSSRGFYRVVNFSSNERTLNYGGEQKESTASETNQKNHFSAFRRRPLNRPLVGMETIPPK